MFATIYLPNFYLQAAIRHHPKLRAQPVALIDAAKSKVSIIQLNDLAEKAGVAKGMAPSQALARCLQVVIRTRERAREIFGAKPEAIHAGIDLEVNGKGYGAPGGEPNQTCDAISDRGSTSSWRRSNSSSSANSLAVSPMRLPVLGAKPTLVIAGAITAH